MEKEGSLSMEIEGTPKGGREEEKSPQGIAERREE